MRRLAWTFAARIGDKYQIRLTRPIWESMYVLTLLSLNMIFLQKQQSIIHFTHIPLLHGQINAVMKKRWRRGTWNLIQWLNSFHWERAEIGQCYSVTCSSPFCHPPSFCQETQIHYKICVEVVKMYFSPLQHIFYLHDTVTYLLQNRQQCSKPQWSRDITKPTKWHVRPAKTQISLGSAQSDQSLNCPHEESLGP